MVAEVEEHSHMVEEVEEEHHIHMVEEVEEEGVRSRMLVLVLLVMGVERLVQLVQLEWLLLVGLAKAVVEMLTSC